MINLILRKLQIDDENAFLNALSKWDTDYGFDFGQSYKHEMTFSNYISLLHGFEVGEGLPNGSVPETSLFAFIDGEIVGGLAIRHELNDFLLKIGGHIGFGVLPRFRRKGYAKKMLALALPLAKNLGISRVLITCDDNNIGSIKTIEANGGLLENIFIQNNKRPRKRYWIDLI